MTDQPQRIDQIVRFFGLVIMAGSGLWTAFSGYCIVDGIHSLFSRDALTSATAIFVVGAGIIGAAVGYGIMRVGHALWQGR